MATPGSIFAKKKWKEQEPEDVAGEVMVALLRGVNIGGSGKLPMAGFRALLEGLGCEGVASYIQSGNAVFRSAEPRAALGPRIAEAVEAGYGFRPAVFLLTLGELEAALAGNPFPVPEELGKTVHLIFLGETVEGLDLAPLVALAKNGERVAARGRVLYLHAPAGVGRSELVAKMGRFLPGPTTGRNLRSVMAIAAMARAL
jgi:uncharacterized protein (DUF1697 family)